MRYQSSLKSSLSDELLNTYLIRPLAWLFVLALRRTPIRPEMIVGLNTLLATAAAALFAVGTPGALRWAGGAVLAKILFDGVDGQLARATDRVTRTGRFLDSLSDFYTNLLIFCAVGFSSLSRPDARPLIAILWFLCFWVMTLQCSYFNYYQVAFLEAAGRRPASRVDERVREADLREARHTLLLQRLYLWTYGWQDRIMAALDRWTWQAGGGAARSSPPAAWYEDPRALRTSSFLGLGTLLTPLGVLALLDRVTFYLPYVYIGGNAVLLAAIAYRFRLAARLRAPRRRATTDRASS